MAYRGYIKDPSVHRSWYVNPLSFKTTVQHLPLHLILHGACTQVLFYKEDEIPNGYEENFKILADQIVSNKLDEIVVFTASEYDSKDLINSKTKTAYMTMEYPVKILEMFCENNIVDTKFTP